MDKRIFRKMSYGVYILTTLDGERPTGCTVNSVMQITSEPATIAVSVNHDNYTNECMKRSGVFAFHILSEKSDPALIGTFGFQCGRNVEKFERLSWELKAGAPVLDGGYNGYVVCKIIDSMETGTHTVFLGEVVDAAIVDGDTDAMTYAYYHQVVKGKSPKNAPTYLPEEAVAEEEPAPAAADVVKKTVYVCQVCGYVHEGDSLPDGFRCPLCRQGAERFKREEREM